VLINGEQVSYTGYFKKEFEVGFQQRILLTDEEYEVFAT